MSLTTAPRWGNPSQRPELSLGDDARAESLGYSLFLRSVLGGALPAVRSATWATSARTLDALPDLAYHGRHGSSQDAVLEPNGAVARVHLDDGRVYAYTAAITTARADELLDELREALEPLTYDEGEPRVPVTFWSLGQHGPQARTRSIDVPPWETIASHYNPQSREPLDRLVASPNPGSGGQLVLWHGSPGTGKTYALRALAWEWRAWCDLHYITDPETFFGEDGAAYMLDVLLHDSDDGMVSGTLAGGSKDGAIDEEPPPPDPRAKDGRWRLLVLEDTGELMARDAKDRTGQGLSRLLNVVDGLIGQGLRILVLVTTNDEVRELHPAVSRAGRCSARIQFAGLPHEEAIAWLSAQDVPEDEAREIVRTKIGDRRTITIADLFALRDDRATSHERQPEPAGFAPS